MRLLPASLRLPTLCLMAHAVEHRRPNGIFTDPSAHDWFEQLSNLYQMPQVPGELLDGIIVRSLVIDYALLNFVSRHTRPTVIDLGCGFSTRYHRLKPFVDVWMHVDLPEVLMCRAGFYTLGKHELVIMRNLEEMKVLDIPAGSLKYATPSDNLYLAEGVLNHLGRERANLLVQQLCARCRGGTLIGTLATENGVKALKHPALPDLGCGDMLWGISDTASIESFIAPARLVRIWTLGKIAMRLGIARPDKIEEASGVVFLASL